MRDAAILSDQEACLRIFTVHTSSLFTAVERKRGLQLVPVKGTRGKSQEAQFCENVPLA